MTDAELELTVARWLSADAAATYAPDALRGRILDIPTSRAPLGWWHRFATMPAVGASLATASIAGVLIATMFFGLFDRPAGTDGETCSNRQVQQALDNLRDASGYRYVNVRQTHQLDLDAGLSFDDPQYVWTDGSTAEGAYLAPDRVIEHVTSTSGGLFDRGYLQHLQINGHTYRLMEVDGTETWVEDTNWPTPNLVYGYIGAAFPSFSVPLVSGADWGGTPVTSELSGEGGCTAATAIPLSDDMVGFETQRAVAVRVDVRSLRPTAVAIGPAEGEQPREGDERSTWQITWETPDGSEFIQPTDALPDPNTVEHSFVPTPSPSPLEADPGAWPATELAAGSGANISDVVAGEDRFVSVGAEFPDGKPDAAIWTSTDGATWELLEDLPDGENLGLTSVDWNGSVFLAMGLRDHIGAEGEYVASRPEVWLSDDGLTWRTGGEIGPGADTDEVGNPSRPIFTGTRWVAGGSIWNLEDNQNRPAFFISSDDGATWQTVELDDVGSGSLGTVVVLPDGSLLALGCESPGATNSSQFGEACYQRPWRSDNGTEWTPGAISDTYVSAMTRWGERLIGIVSASDPTGQSEPTSRLATSVDGATWEDLGGFSPGIESPYAIEVVGDNVVILGQIGNESTILGTAWRSADGATWENLPLGFPDGAGEIGVSLGGVVQTPSGLAILGGAVVGGADSAAVLWLEPPAD